MNNDQINQLAKEYAENKNKLFSDRISPTETWKEADIREFKQCVDFLLRDHLIVDKSKLEQEFEMLAECQKTANKDDFYFLEGRMLQIKILLNNIKPTEK